VQRGRGGGLARRRRAQGLVNLRWRHRARCDAASRA
jgi:hypothetical protein